MTVKSRDVPHMVNGYPSLGLLAHPPEYMVTDENHAHDQNAVHDRKVESYLLPLLERIGAHSVLDVGCGIGHMVMSLLQRGFDAYGLDLPDVTKFWKEGQLPNDRFFVVDPMRFEIPFDDASFDAVFSFGVIEHIGTHTGHADRRPNYHDVRRQWVAEQKRIVKPGGYLLFAGPNRRFPIDTAHDLDSQASYVERRISRLAGLSLHRIWGDYFLWSYSDVEKYVDDSRYKIAALSPKGLFEFSRVPSVVRGAAQIYVDYLPVSLLGTGFNPWTLALVRKAPETGLHRRSDADGGLSSAG